MCFRVPRALLFTSCSNSGASRSSAISLLIRAAQDGTAAMFDPDAARHVILHRLPVRTCWLIAEEPLRYDFSQARERLRPVVEEVEARWFVEAWRPLLIFGTCDHADGAELGRGSQSLEPTAR
jgi:hypothetical protein